MTDIAQSSLGGTAVDTFEKLSGLQGNPLDRFIPNLVQRVAVHPGGLHVSYKNTDVVVKWEDITDFYELHVLIDGSKVVMGDLDKIVAKHMTTPVEALRDQPRVRTTHAISLTYGNGQSVLMNGGLERMLELARVIRQAVTPRLVETMKAALARGEEIRLSHWVIRPETIQAKSDRHPIDNEPVAWDDIVQCKVQLGHLSLTLKDGRVKHLAMDQLSNRFAFLAVMQDRVQQPITFTEGDTFMRSYIRLIGLSEPTEVGITPDALKRAPSAAAKPAMFCLTLVLSFIAISVFLCIVVSLLPNRAAGDYAPLVVLAGFAIIAGIQQGVRRWFARRSK